MTDACRSWTTHPLYWQPRRREIVWEKVGPSIGGGWKHSHDVVQQKSQRSMTKMFLVILLIVLVLAMWRRLALIGRRIVLEPTPLAGRSITPLARRDGPAYAGSSSGCEGPGWTGAAAVKVIVGPSPRGTSLSRIIFWSSSKTLRR